MALESARDRELAELVADHVFVDQNRNVLAPVMDGERQAHHFRNDHRATRPGLDRALVVCGTRDFHLLLEVMIDERAFLERASHLSTPAIADDELRRALVLA